MVKIHELMCHVIRLYVPSPSTNLTRTLSIEIGQLAYINGTIGLMEVAAREIRIILTIAIELGAATADTYGSDMGSLVVMV